VVDLAIYVSQVQVLVVVVVVVVVGLTRVLGQDSLRLAPVLSRATLSVVDQAISASQALEYTITNGVTY